MSPEERQMLSDLFIRVRSAAATPRDSDAETLVNQSVRDQPYAPYYLAQAVIVQDQGLHAAADRIKQLEARIDELEQGSGRQTQGSNSFLGGLGSLFGGSTTSAQQPAYSSAPSAGGPWGGAQGRSAPDYGQSMPPQQQQPVGPWNPQPSAPSAGGSFLRGALGTAAGVAGGVLLADSLRDLFSPHMSGLGMGGAPFGMGTPEAPVDETVINNNYFGDDGRDDNSQSNDQQDVSDNDDQDYDNSGDMDDNSFDV